MNPLKYRNIRTGDLVILKLVDDKRVQVLTIAGERHWIDKHEFTAHYRPRKPIA